MKRFWRKIKTFFVERWVWILAGTVTGGLIVMAFDGISKLDPYGRISLQATMPLWILASIVSGAIAALIYVSVLRGAFSNIRKKSVKAETVKVKFADVLGIDEVKEEALEVVQLLKDHALLSRIGGKILRGLLLIGPPGCGKTYLAKAIATEAGLPFLTFSASEFVEVFVGVGSSRVRKLFIQARKLAYSRGGCIIFIDEIDAVGRQRTFNFGGGAETNSTLNQLLVEMDGLAGAGENVVVIGATNASEEVLDAALLRPGRFDRLIYIDRPNLEGREELFRHYLGKVISEPTIDVGRLARNAVYKSPADIENIIKEAALIATRKRKEQIGYKEISEAMERIELGIKHKRKMTPREREMTAFHESGHLITTFLLHPTNDVFKASIISRRNTLGVVYSQPREELFSHDRDHLLANIKVALSGYAAEKVQFGVTTTGVSSDFRKAMGIAHGMVWSIGMGLSGQIGDFSALPRAQVSDTVKNRLNEETNQILQSCLKEVERLLRKERPILERFARELMEKEELEYDEIEAIFKEYGKKPLYLQS
ncbi:MAG: AAA family ATPase [Candidatus Omnitrophica bacterium]|nr:AAA family ATPase [Candidatus Omnitrophota bacterium]